jgi:hypothetical protein
MTEENQAAERLLRQREAVAKEFDIADINDWRVRRLALLMAAYAAYEDQMATNGTLDITPPLALDETIQVIRQQLKAPKEIAVKVEIVKSKDSAPPKSASVGGLKACRRCGWTPPGRDKVERCYKCSWKRGDDHLAPWKPIDITGSPSLSNFSCRQW